MKVVRTAVRSVLVLLILSLFAFGQAETGMITGTVTDASGAVVPNATVTATNTQTQQIRNTTSNSAGIYTLTNLQPGIYSVSVQAANFGAFTRQVQVTVGGRSGLDAQLAVQATGTTVEVTAEGGAAVNTESQALSQVVSSQQITQLPTVTRNPYNLVGTAGNVSDTDPSGRGTGYSINGQRSASTDILLDGAENVDLFSATVGQATPLDSVQEFRVLTSDFSAEYGRASGGVVNVATKAGTNSFHGTAYEFNRISALASNTYDNAATLRDAITSGTCKNASDRSCPGRKGVFTRNQPGYSIGGPIVKNKLFFFNSTEWTRVRSTATLQKWVIDPAFLSRTASNTQSFFTPYKLRTGATKTNSVTLGQLQAAKLAGTTGAIGAIPGSTPVLDEVSFALPSNAGGGLPQNTYSTVSRVDWNLSDRTQIYGRYALQSSNYLPGTNAYSVYTGFDTGENIYNNNALISMTHVFSPTVVWQAKGVYNRLNDFQPLGSVPAVPTLYMNSTRPVTITVGGASHRIQMPGYLPESPGSAIPFGGPQNLYETYQDLSWTTGKHQFRFGGQYIHTRDNRTFGAYEEAVENLGSGSVSTSLSNLVLGQLVGFQAAVFPQGKFPCQQRLTTASGKSTLTPVTSPDCTVTLPVSAPRFSRNNRYHDWAAYVQDAWKFTPRVTFNLGVRYEYYGVQHNADPNLDSNFYLGQGGTPFDQIRSGFVATVPNSPIHSLWNPDYNNIAPRLGFAIDLFGDGKTSLRGGWGISYERNFGNVTFNVIQNPPNYAVLSIIPSDVGGTLPITSNNAGPLGGSTGSKTLPPVSLRAPKQDIQTAYASMWSAAIERELAPNTVLSIEYSGNRGYHLYSIENPNRVGAGNVFMGDPCQTGSPANCTERLDYQYGAINRRGDAGFSYYNGLNVGVRSSNLWNKGLSFTANYTYAHAIDNLSSTFSESSNNFNLGLLDPWDPTLDKGNAEFDLRQRFVFSGIWQAFPSFSKSSNWISRQVLGGWSFAPIFSARTGSPFSIFDCTNAVYEVCPRYMPLSGPTGGSGLSNPIHTGVNEFTYLTLPGSLANGVPGAGDYLNPVSGTSEFPTCPAGANHYAGCKWPSNMVRRDSFYGPHNWNLDFAAYKDFKLTERFTMQFRGELFNVLNHHNFFVVGDQMDVSNGTPIMPAKKGGTGTVNDERRNVQLALKLIF
jgi:hypothetical protein